MKKRGLLILDSRNRRRMAGLFLVLLLAGLLITDIPLRGEISAIKFYKNWISPVSSSFATCRFSPT